MISLNYFQSLKKTLDTIAIQTGFIIRQRKIDACQFLSLITFGLISMNHPSLGGMVDALDLSISRVAFHKKFSAPAVKFLKSCLLIVLNNQMKLNCSINFDLFNMFRRVIIFDSTSWDVREGLSTIFPGSGGCASQANCKLQVGYDYKSGEFIKFDLTPGNNPDNKYTLQLARTVKTGDLLLLDLGYFCFNTLRSIVEKGAFFVTRYLIRTTVFNSETGEAIELHKKLVKLASKTIEFQVVLGSDPDTNVPCRLICIRVSEQQAQKRRQRLLKNAKKKGRKPSKQHLILADWTLMITNVDAKVLPSKMVWILYTLRWQIELLFKQFKSILLVHKSNTENQYRLQCEIFGKLIAATITHKIHGAYNSFYWNNCQREISIEKLTKRIQERAFIIFKMITISYEAAVIYLQEEIPRIIKNSMKCRQKNRKTTLECITSMYKQSGLRSNVISLS